MGILLLLGGVGDEVSMGVMQFIVIHITPNRQCKRCSEPDLADNGLGSKPSEETRQIRLY